MSLHERMYVPALGRGARVLGARGRDATNCLSPMVQTKVSFTKKASLQMFKQTGQNVKKQ